MRRLTFTASKFSSAWYTTEAAHKKSAVSAYKPSLSSPGRESSNGWGGVQHWSTEDASNSSDPKIGRYIMVYPSYPNDKGSIASGKGGFQHFKIQQEDYDFNIFQPGYSSNFGPTCLKLCIQNV